MGSRSDATIAAFQEKTGIKPAKGEYADMLNELAQKAFDLIQVVTLEKSGIRDGDGHWHGSDVMGGSVDDITRLWGNIKKRRF